MKFDKNEPKIQCIKRLDNFNRFLQLGQEKLCDFLKKLLNLDQIRIQSCELKEKIWNSELSIMNESHQVLIDKILASDGAMVINKEGNIIFESVFTVVS